MRFSPPGVVPSVETLLGERSAALEVRARPATGPDTGRPGDGPLAWVRFQAAQVEPALRTALGREGCLFPAPAPGGLALYRGPREWLVELGERFEDARCLVAAQAAADRPGGPWRLLGVINATPDSFSDGGRFLEPARAIEQGLKLLAEGADMLDVGGESTRPGASEVSPEEELARVLPVVRGLAEDRRGIVSVDTSKTRVAEASFEAGARVLNDVRAGAADPSILPCAADHQAGVILMHMRGSPADMQRRPAYDDVVREVCAFLRERARAAWKAGVAPTRIALDPGIGFGKRLEDNLDLMHALPELRSLGFPLCLGVSRKSFLGALSGEERPERRLPETLAALTLGARLGAEIHRVHDVAAARAALAVTGALCGQELAGGGGG